MSYRALIKHNNCFVYASDPVGQTQKPHLFDIYHEDHRLVKDFGWSVPGAAGAEFGLQTIDDGLALINQAHDLTCKIWVYADTVHLLWQNMPKGAVLKFNFTSDAMDSFEARGFPPPLSRTVEWIVDGQAPTWIYRGRDGIDRAGRLDIDGAAVKIDPAQNGIVELTAAGGDVVAQFRFARQPKGQKAVFTKTDSGSYARLQKEYADFRAHFGALATTEHPWLRQAMADLFILHGKSATGKNCLHAGTPWFACLFGRDSLITAEQCLSVAPMIARIALDALSDCQATAVVPFEDAEPGKIAHEIRNNERNNLKDLPFGRYYAGIDTTLLYISLAAAYARQTGDAAYIKTLAPHLRAATGWMTARLDSEKFITYRVNKKDEGEYGLAEKGWKDGAPVLHADGNAAAHPIALCEVQGYAYRALYDAAFILRDVLGDAAEETWHLRLRAARLKKDFDAHFWCADIGTYAMALDRDLRPCRTVTSNPGHLLRTGIVDDKAKIAAIAAGFADPARLFSGWGLRTLSLSDKSFDASSYQLGGVWPHDTLECLRGLWSAGEKETALKLARALGELAVRFDYRLPELIGGHPRSGDDVVAYFKGCSPQAWSASIPFALYGELELRRALGLYS